MSCHWSCEPYKLHVLNPHCSLKMHTDSLSVNYLEIRLLSMWRATCTSDQFVFLSCYVMSNRSAYSISLPNCKTMIAFAELLLLYRMHALCARHHVTLFSHMCCALSHHHAPILTVPLCPTTSTHARIDRTFDYSVNARINNCFTNTIGKL